MARREKGFGSKKMPAGNMICVKVNERKSIVSDWLTSLATSDCPLNLWKFIGFLRFCPCGSHSCPLAVTFYGTAMKHLPFILLGVTWLPVLVSYMFLAYIFLDKSWNTCVRVWPWHRSVLCLFWFSENGYTNSLSYLSSYSPVPNWESILTSTLF